MEHIGEFLTGGALARDRAITFFEVGAHVGTHTRWFLEVFPAIDLWIFEPDPRNAAELRRQGLDRRTRMFELAIGDRDGEMELNLSSGPVKKGDARTTLQNWTFSSSLKRPRRHLRAYPWVKFQFTAKVKVARLDTLKREHGFGVIDFLWADIQGAEDMLIAGGQETLAQARYFYTEFADEELYEGQIPLGEIVRRLPGGEGAWEIVHKFEDDVLLRNRALP